MDFSKDILISYAHIDDEPLMEGQKGWIEEFHRSLDIRLSQLLGEKPKIWRDPVLQGNDFFSDEIVDQFSHVALLVSILTPRYIKSDWCLKEVMEFKKACEKNIGIRVQNKSRILKIIKTPVDLNDHPDPIKEVLGYEFYSIDSQTGRPREYGKLFGKESELAYWTRLDDVAHDITDLLQELSQTTGQQTASDETVAPDKLKVYLAETSSDISAYRENIKRELQDYNCLVYPDQPMPLQADAYEKTAIAMLKECQMAIHLVGANYGIVPEGTNKSIVVLQNDFSQDQSSRSDLKRLIWLPPNLEIEDKRQKDFLNDLNNGANAQKGAEILETFIEDFKFTVHKELEQIREARTAKKELPVVPLSTSSSTSPAMVYLICDQRDMDNIGELEDFLFNQGYDVVVPVFEGEEGQIRLDHQDNLIACDAVMIYYGEGNELWMRSKHRELMKIAGYGRTTPLQCKGIYLAPPFSESKARFRVHDAMIIDGQEGLKPENLKPYIATLQQLKGQNGE